tara:strand:+ start:194 stop:301 length:108 start_codon:yes stop_codon:yes gene_type:complete
METVDREVVVVQEWIALGIISVVTIYQIIKFIKEH